MKATAATEVHLHCTCCQHWRRFERQQDADDVASRRKKREEKGLSVPPSDMLLLPPATMKAHAPLATLGDILTGALRRNKRALGLF